METSCCGESLACKRTVRAARRSIVTVEEQVDSLNAAPNACVLPHWVVNAVCMVPRGATPSYAHGYYDRDNVFYQQWDSISRDREIFTAWIREHVLNTADFAEYLRVQNERHRREAVQ